MATEHPTTKSPILKTRRRLPPAAVLMLGFAAIIIFGAFLLALPVSAASAEWTPFIDALFMSASAVCVTGLSVVTSGVYFSPFGQIVLLLLVQIGGLGFMTFTTLLLLLVGKKISFRSRIAIQVALGKDSNKGVIRLVRTILILTFSFEAAGALLLLPPFVADFGAQGIWYAVFTAVSAFCNAGIDIFPDERGFTRFVQNPYVGIVIMLLIIAGGIGVAVMTDAWKNKGRFRKFTLHTKIVLTVSSALLLFGWAFFAFAEWNNPETLGGLSGGYKVFAALFQSASTRTAGFRIVDQNALSEASKFFSDILMFIGASPGSTGGGIKTTTFAILILTVVAGFRRKSEVTAGRHAISYKNVLKATAVLFTALLVVAFLTVFLLLAESGNALMAEAGLYGAGNMLHEAFGAFSTAGMNGTIMPYLSVQSKCAIIVTIFIGRVGMLPVGLMFATENDDMIKYPETNVPI